MVNIIYRFIVILYRYIGYVGNEGYVKVLNE